MSKTAVRADFLAVAVHFSVNPVPAVPAAVTPAHLALAKELAFAEFALVNRIIGKDAAASAVPHAVNPATSVGAAVLVRHFPFNHLAIDVFPFENSSVCKLHDAVAMFVIVLEAAFVKISIAVR